MEQNSSSLELTSESKLSAADNDKVKKQRVIFKTPGEAFAEVMSKWSPIFEKTRERMLIKKKYCPAAHEDISNEFSNHDVSKEEEENTGDENDPLEFSFSGNSINDFKLHWSVKNTASTKVSNVFEAVHPYSDTANSPDYEGNSYVKSQNLKLWNQKVSTPVFDCSFADLRKSFGPISSQLSSLDREFDNALKTHTSSLFSPIDATPLPTESEGEIKSTYQLWELQQCMFFRIKSYIFNIDELVSILNRTIPHCRNSDEVKMTTAEYETFVLYMRRYVYRLNKIIVCSDYHTKIPKRDKTIIRRNLQYDYLNKLMEIKLHGNRQKMVRLPSLSDFELSLNGEVLQGHPDSKDRDWSEAILRAFEEFE
ncbi:uncharacterized protein J8A68_004876 [[Candida] subhashii]|uniref:Uncharacterized protein n=1 Tax=[Candida] subhashii TaxID=561895 RepID=A0A8J5UEZ3_9ASCO|nr:uncharacterized protein J8A68_004876 [[Candida] subhashii]KAG7661608.1 hypothetical protein J8A68_004876 [[Candida] subhashii]